MLLGLPTWSGRSANPPVPLRSEGQIGEKGVLLCKVSTQLNSQPPTKRFRPALLEENGSWYRPLATKRCRASNDERLYSASMLREFCGTEGLAAFESRLDAVSSALENV